MDDEEDDDDDERFGSSGDDDDGDVGGDGGGGDVAATEEGIARGGFSGGILHNFIVTLFTPKCNLCNLDYNLGAKPLNSLNLNGMCACIQPSILIE